MMEKKEEIRPIYSELQGCLSQAPDLNQCAVIYSAQVWQHVNQTIDELSRISSEDYSRFKIPSEKDSVNQDRVVTDVYRTKLGSLISRLYGKYFADEQPPFSGMPQTVNIQTQQQSQTVYMQIIMELRDQLTRSETKFKEGSKERGFIEKAKDCLKAAISGTTSMAQLMLLLLNIAKECGLSIEDMLKVFGA